MNNVVEASEISLERLRSEGAAMASSLDAADRQSERSSLDRERTGRVRCARISNEWRKTNQSLHKLLSELRRNSGQAQLGGLRAVRENRRLLKSALLETKEGLKKLRDLPPRVLPIAASFLNATSFRFSEELLGAYLDGVQSIQSLGIAEIWAMKPLLKFTLAAKINDVAGSILNGTQRESTELPDLIASLRQAGETDWKEFFERANAIEELLRADPSGTYARMDFDTRDQYRSSIVDLARYSNVSERAVVENALKLARESQGERSTHIGYYLIDEGRPRLGECIGYRPRPMERIRRLLKTYPNAFYLTGIELATFIIVVCALTGLSSFTPIFAGFFLLLIPATQSAVDLMNHLVTFLLRPGRLPKLDLSDGVPEEFSTMVAVPVLLLNETQVRQLVDDLEVRFLANPDPHIHYTLLSDSPDSAREFDENDELVGLCRELIDGLNRKYSGLKMGGFFLLHRHRVYYESEQKWLGWERKRGKLLDLNKLLRNEYDSFPVKAGDLSVLPGIRYVITLDADTQLPRGTAHRLIGTMAHPLNRAVIDPTGSIVVKGYGILQPRVGVSVQSAGKSRLANIYSGQTGFDIYTRAVSDVYQDLYGEGSFTGKGIYDVDALRAVLERRFPRSALLSHDLIEGAYARAGLVSDIEVIDDYPSHFSAYSRRKHRWVRGDWQIVTWLFEHAPDESGNQQPNPIALVSRWKILDNLRRSLFEPAMLVLLLAGWFFLPGGPAYWTRISLLLFFLPVFLQVAFSAIRLVQAHTVTALKEFVTQSAASIASVALAIVFLAHQALLDLDAIIRSNVRRIITRKRLLEWETAAEAEVGRAKRAPVDVYLDLIPLFALVIAVLLYEIKRPAIQVAWPLLLAWGCSGLISRWLNRPPGVAASKISDTDKELLRRAALRTWRYFRAFSNAETNWLIPDNVQELAPRIANRISPTNLGLLLNARLTACDLGFLTPLEFVEQTENTFRTMDRMLRYCGHFYNWYDTQTLEPLTPLFVSSVDSGNLAGSLWALKQGCLEMARKPLLLSSAWAGLREYFGLLRDFSPLHAELLSSAENLGADDSEWLSALPELERNLLRLESQQTDSGEDTRWWITETLARVKAIREMAQNQDTEGFQERLQDLASEADRFVEKMDFRVVYNKRRKLLSIGYNTSDQRLEQSVYDLLASESRLAFFVAVAKGDIPQESWFHLGRAQTLYKGNQLLLSWTGTMFEYLMPTLWMKSYPNTLIHRSLHAAVRCQQKYARSRRVPWGISEAAYAYRDEAGNYQYQAFGIAALGMKESMSPAVVISPYSTFLALAVDPTAAMANLRRMARMNWIGTFGFYESADYTAPAVAGRRGEHEIIRCWMAHHQGMILLAICNLLCDAPMQSRFHAEPRVLATELILHERALPAHVEADSDRDDAEVPLLAPAPAVGG